MVFHHKKFARAFLVLSGSLVLILLLVLLSLHRQERETLLATFAYKAVFP